MLGVRFLEVQTFQNQGVTEFLIKFQSLESIWALSSDTEAIFVAPYEDGNFLQKSGAVQRMRGDELLTILPKEQGWTVERFFFAALVWREGWTTGMGGMG